MNKFTSQTRTVIIRLGVFLFVVSIMGACLPLSAALFGHEPTEQELIDQLSRLPEDRSSRKKGLLYSELGTLQSKAGHHSEAVASFENSLMNPLSLDVKRHVTVTMGKSELQLGRIDRAIESYEKALECDPKNWERLRDLGILYEKVDLLDNARDLFQRALRLRGVSPSVYFDAGRIFRKMLLFEKADTYLLQAESHGFKSVDLDREFAMIDEGCGRFQAAAVHFLKVTGSSATVEDWGHLLYLGLQADDKNLTQTALDQLKSHPGAEESLPFYNEVAELFKMSPDEVLLARRQNAVLQTLLDESLTSSTP